MDLSFDGMMVNLNLLKENIMKKYGKKVAVLGLALMMALAVFGFAGCSGTSTPSASVSAGETPAAATPAPTEAPSYTIGVTQIVEHPSLDLCRKGAIDKLAELGFTEGRNLTIKYQSAQGDMTIATTIGQQFVADKVDVILAIATPSAQASYAAAMGNTPLVFSAVSEPAAAGLANADGSNIAGVTGTSDKLPVEATFDLIKALTPDAVKVGILHSTNEVNSDMQLAEAKSKAGGYGLEIIDVGITSTNEVASALDTLLPQVDVVMNLTDNTVVSALALEVQKCNEAKVPLYGSEDTQVKGGALASAGVDYYALGQKTGEMIAAILQGKAAESIPNEALKSPLLFANSDRLTALGLPVPDSLKDKIQVVATEAAK